MVAYDPDGHVVLFVRTVLPACELLHLCDDRREDLCLVDALLALENRDRPLDTHACVDALAAHLVVCAVLVLAVAHEDVVPDLEVLATGAAGMAVGTACGAAGVDEHLRIGSAGSGLSCRTPPVVLLGHVEDPVLADAKALPDTGGLLVTRCVLIPGEDGHGQPFRIDAEMLREELVAVLDSLLLEVGAQRPVAQHLEEREMMRVAHAVDVAGTDALLVVDQPVACRMLGSQDVRYEGVHSRRGEKHGRIVLGNQRRP